MSNNPKHQGKFHLLAIFAIPVLLVAIFLIQQLILTLLVILILGIAAWILFRK